MNAAFMPARLPREMNLAGKRPTQNTGTAISFGSHSDKKKLANLVHCLAVSETQRVESARTQADALAKLQQEYSKIIQEYSSNIALIQHPKTS